MLFPRLANPDDRLALRFPERSLTYRELAGAVATTAAALHGHRRVALWASNRVHTALAVLAALAAGVPLVPINPRIGPRELAHIISDAEPDLLLAESTEQLPVELDGLPRREAAPHSSGVPLPGEPPAEQPALIIYTSGTTGPPKGVVLPRRAIECTLDALADAWQWTARDVVVHALPLFHVHGLILGTLGPLRLGGASWHLGRFDVVAAAHALAGEASMLFGVPTMYSRLAAEVEHDPELAEGVRAARLLVSGSAALPATLHRRITVATGQHIVERYGMTETMFNTSVRADGERRPGTVGLPLPGVNLRLVDQRGTVIETSDDETIGEIEVRGDNLFTEYLNRPEATSAAMHDGFFATGDMATRAADGYLRIVGRASSDLIKSGGYKIGAGEIENVLLEHPAVREVAVTGEADDDLGERIVAWVVSTEDHPNAAEFVEHVAAALSPYKRPREVRFLDSLPRNDMGKIRKHDLPTAGERG